MRAKARKVALVTLGCPKNQVDSEVLAGTLQRHGLELIGDVQNADVVCINTCGFIQEAKKESIQAILQTVRVKKKTAKVIVWGCLVEREKEKLQKEIPEADAFFGVESFREIGKWILGNTYQWSEESFSHRILSTPPHTAYLKIAEGCDHRCTFCTIPLFKGKYRSRPVSLILEEAHALAERGVKELILVAQDTTAYGSDFHNGTHLTTLLQSLSEIPGIEWIRILYSHPLHVDEVLVEYMGSEPKICKYLDLPLQHIADPVLQAMGRGISRKKTEQLIALLRKKIPGLILRTTMIVGFPGEEEAHFQELLEFVKQVRFERLGVFPFSPEPGTPAFHFRPRISKSIVKRRYHHLMEAQKEISESVHRTLEGKVVSVLVDGFDKTQGLYFGRTQGDAPEIDPTVWIRGKVQIGCIVPVLIEGTSAYDLVGIPIKSNQEV